MLCLDSALRRHATSDPGRAAVLFEDIELGYGDLVDMIDRLAGMLAGRGLRPGQVVALLMTNSPAFLALAFAVNRLGAIFLPINYRLAGPEIDYILEHSGAACLFHDDDVTTPISACLPRIGLDQAARRNPSLLAGSVSAAPRHERSPDDIVRLMYTSGTTDRPKGVGHSCANLAWKCFDHALVLGLSQHDRLLVCGPLYHVGAFDLPGIAVLMFGGTLFVHREFSAAAVLDSIAHHRLTGAWLAPAMLNRLMEAGPGGRDLSSLRWCVGGGERTPEARIRDFAGLFPAGRYIDSYGLTETCSGDTFMPPGYEITKIGSVGTPVPHVAITIRDEAGAELPPDSEGEICIKGPKVTPGYWRDPDRTAASFVDGWLRTGDAGVMDREGFLTLTDRKKDMIISGGENIASSEIERVIYLLPSVSEAAVVGVPDVTWGERPVAVVVLREGMELSGAELDAHCLAHLARFKRPAALVIRQQLPRNASGKVLKRQLREEIVGAFPAQGA
jgi:fatty-acyl-CoA synthase